MITNITMTDRSVNYYPSSNNLSSKIGDPAEKYSLEKISINFKTAKRLLEANFSGWGKIQTSLAGSSRKTAYHAFRVTIRAEKGQVVAALSA